MKYIAPLLLAFATSLAGHVQAAALVINPSSDGSLYTCDGCNTVSEGAYVLTSGYIQGAVKFSSAPIDGEVTQALLTVNPYGLPLWGPSVDVYGYGTEVGQLVAADANAGTFLGTWVLPALGYGQDAFFDVTSFIAGTNASFFAFNLRSGGTNVFSSLEYNYGHPSQLHVVTAPVPEPETVSLMLAGLVAGAAWIRRRNGAKA